MVRLKRYALLLVLTMFIASVPLAAADEVDSEGVYRFSESDAGGVVFARDSAPQAQAEENPLIPTATLSPQVAELPWNLMLVNKNNPVPDDWEVNLVTLSNGRQVDERIMQDLQNMFNACRSAGLKPKVNTAYRTYEDQKQMLVSKYRQFKNQGLSHEAAQVEALKLANYPGYSEHQLGLAIDITSSDPDTCSNESVWKWMFKHCAEYGFIWRYPSVKTEITGINNEYWHYRYVGVEAATYIMQNELCLEEYLQQNYGIPY